MQLSVIVLAAGASNRFGSPKQLCEINLQPMLVERLKTLQQAGLTDIWAVLGANADTIKDVVPDHIKVLICEHWQQGLGVSLGFAAKQLASRSSHLMIVLSDQVAISAAQFSQLVQTAKQSPEHIIAAKYQNGLGVPAIFPQRYFNDLIALQGDQGAKKVVTGKGAKVISVTMESASIDIDTQQDYQKWLQR